MEQAGLVAVAVFMAGVIYGAGWFARGQAEHERRLGLLESTAGEISRTLGIIRRALHVEDEA